jgi:hypothetical protein
MSLGMTTLTTEPAAEPEKSSTSLPRTRLGEELPIFCERCGYSLNGLPQTRCDHCSILQFHCPECGHHQPINTLRPAFQRMLGRLRAFALALVVFVKLNFFGWVLFAWFMVGAESSWERNWDAPRTVVVNGLVVQRTQGAPRYVPARANLDMILGFGIFGFAFGAVARMLLLRWRRGFLVGLILGALVVTAVAAGAHARYTFDREDYPSPPFVGDFLRLIMLAGAMTVFGAAVVWPIWSMLVHVFLPKRVAQGVLDWQRFRTGPASALARE